MKEITKVGCEVHKVPIETNNKALVIFFEKEENGATFHSKSCQNMYNVIT